MIASKFALLSINKIILLPRTLCQEENKLLFLARIPHTMRIPRRHSQETLWSHWIALLFGAAIRRLDFDQTLSLKWHEVVPDGVVIVLGDFSAGFDADDRKLDFTGGVSSCWLPPSRFDYGRFDGQERFDMIRLRGIRDES